MNNKKLLKIMVPVLMICGVIGIWAMQTIGSEEHTVANSTNSQENAEQAEQIPLHVSSVDITQLTEHGLPIIIDFGATECIPCKEMAPVLETLNTEMQGEAVIQFVDVWENSDAATNFPVQLIPTQLLVNSDGTPYVPSEEITEQINFVMYADMETEEHIFTVHQGGLTEEQMRIILTDMGV